MPIKDDIYEALKRDVTKYAPDCAASVKRNSHMNHYDGGVPIVASEVEAWLHGFVAHFAARYNEGPTSGEVIFGLVRCARMWRREPGLSHSDQPLRDAVIVDFINYTAGARCGMDLALYTSDLDRPEPKDVTYAKLPQAYVPEPSRAEMLVRAFRKRGDEKFDYPSRTLTGNMIADEIEARTEFGRSLVAVAGLLSQAQSATPEFFEKV